MSDNDQTRAKELRAKYVAAMEHAAAIMDEARADGFIFQFPGIQAQPYGPHFVPTVVVLKVMT